MAFGFGDYDSSLLGSRHLAFQRRQGEALKLVLPIAQQQVQEIAEERTAFGPQLTEQQRRFTGSQAQTSITPLTLTEQQRRFTGSQAFTSAVPVQQRVAEGFAPGLDFLQERNIPFPSPQGFEARTAEGGRRAQEFAQRFGPEEQQGLQRLRILGEQLERFEVGPVEFIQAVQAWAGIGRGGDTAFMQREAIALARVASREDMSPTELVEGVRDNEPALVALKGRVDKELSLITQQEFPSQLEEPIAKGIEGFFTGTRTIGEFTSGGIRGLVESPSLLPFTSNIPGVPDVPGITQPLGAALPGKDVRGQILEAGFSPDVFETVRAAGAEVEVDVPLIGTVGLTDIVRPESLALEFIPGIGLFAPSGLRIFAGAGRSVRTLGEVADIVAEPTFRRKLAEAAARETGRPLAVVEREVDDFARQIAEDPTLASVARAGPEPAPVRAVEPPPGRTGGVAQPTVRRVDLEGRAQDTFATERELAGIRESQGGLPLEERAPLRGLEREVAQIAEERTLAQQGLTDPRTRRIKGEAARLRTQVESLGEQERIIRDFEARGLTREQMVDELAQMQLDIEERTLRTLPARRGFSPAFGTAERAEFELARRGRRPARLRERVLPVTEAEGQVPEEVAARLGLEEEVNVAAQAPPDRIVQPEDLIPAGIVDTDAPRQARPGRVGGASETFAGILRDFDQVASEVVTNENPVVRAIIGRTDINPSILLDTPVGKAVTAYQRQRVAAGQLSELAIDAALGVHTRGIAGRSVIRVSDTGMLKGTAWNDAFSRPDNFKWTPAERAFVDDYHRVVEEMEFLRVQAGLEPRATRGPKAAEEGWLYTPRQVRGIRGVDLRRPSNPGLQRHYEDALEGIKKGVNYEDPRETLALHVRQAYREIVDKQFSDHLELLNTQAMQRGGRIFVTPKELVREPVLQRYSNAVLNRLATERAVRTERNAIIRQRRQAAGGITEGRVGVERARTRLAGTQDVPRAQERLSELETAQTALQQQRETARQIPRIRIRDVTEAISPRLQKELSVARREHQSAKTAYANALKAAGKSEIAPGSLFGRTEDTIAIRNWRNRFFPEEDALALRKGIEDFFGALEQSPFVQGMMQVGSTIRFLASVGDFAEPFIQGQTTFAFRPKVWAQATRLHYQAFLDPSVQSRFMRENLSAFQEMAAHGTPIGSAEEFTALEVGQGLSPGKLLEMLPKGDEARRLLQQAGKQTFGRFQASYNTGLGANRALLTDALKTTIPDAAKRQAFIRNMTGGLDSRALGVGPMRRALEGFYLAFSPRFLRSTVALVGNLRLGIRDPVGRASYEALGKLAAAATGLFVVTGLGLGKSWEEIETGLNPLEGKKFLSHEVNGQWIGIGGQVRAIVQVLSFTVANADDPQNFAKLNQRDNPLIAAYTSRGAPAVNILGGAVELTTGADALPFERIDTPADFIKHIGTSALPFAVQGILEGESVMGTLAGLVGARTSSGTRFEELQERFEEEYGRPFNRETDFAIARQNPNLAHLVGRSEEAQQRDEVLVQAEQRLLPLAQSVLQGNPDAGAQFRRERSDFLTFAAGAAAQAFFGTQFPDPETPEGRALAEFHALTPEDFRDPETTQPDYPQFEAARERLLSQLPTEVQQAIKNKMSFVLPEMREVERLYRVARDLLDEAPSQVRGLTSDQHQEVKDFMKTVGQARRTWRETRGISYEDLPIGEAVDIVGRFQERDPAFMRWAQTLRSGVPDDLRSGDYDRFLIEHETELRVFYSDFYRSERILGQLFESRQPVAAGR